MMERRLCEWNQLIQGMTEARQEDGREWRRLPCLTLQPRHHVPLLSALWKQDLSPVINFM